MNHFGKLNKAYIKNVLAENARFFEYYEFILALWPEII